MMTHKEMIEVIAAHEHGARIQQLRIDCGNARWSNCEYPSWDFVRFEYRVAQSAKVKMWQWLCKGTSNRVQLTVAFYESEDAIVKENVGWNREIIGPAKWTEIEVDVA